VKVDLDELQRRLSRGGIGSRDVTPPDARPGQFCARVVLEVCGARVPVIVGGDYSVGVVCVGNGRHGVGHFNAAALRAVADELDRLPGLRPKV
jgi:hypothetical protein